MSEGLRLTNASKRRALDFFEKGIDPSKDFLIGPLPVEIIFPGVLGKNKLHSTSTLSVPPPVSSSAIDSMSLLAFFGLRRR